MRYLDAKKRLAFIMATVKYIKLYLNNNPTTITDDDIKTITAKALPLWCKTKTISSEDITQLIPEIKSLLLNTNDSQPIVTEELATLTLKAYSSIFSNTFVSTEEAVSIAFPQLQGVYLSELVDTVDQIKTKPTLVSAIIAAADGKLGVTDSIDLTTKLPSSIIGQSEISTTDQIIVDLYQLPTQMLKIISQVFTDEATLVGASDSKKIRFIGEASTTSSLALTFYKVAGIKTNAIVNVIDTTSIANQITTYLLTNDSTVFNDSVELKLDKSDTISTNAIILPENQIIIKRHNTDIVQVNSKASTFSTVILELQGFLTQYLEIIEDTCVCDQIAVNADSTTGIKSIAKLYVFDDYILSIDFGRYIYSQGQLITSECLTLDTAQLGIIADIDDLLLEDIQNKELDELIYIKNN